MTSQAASSWFSAITSVVGYDKEFPSTKSLDDLIRAVAKCDEALQLPTGHPMHTRCEGIRVAAARKIAEAVLHGREQVAASRIHNVAPIIMSNLNAEGLLRDGMRQAAAVLMEQLMDLGQALDKLAVAELENRKQ